MTSKTEFYLSELHPKYKIHLDNIRSFSKNLPDSEKKAAKQYIRGYLMALQDATIISSLQFRVLYLYYTIHL